MKTKSIILLYFFLIMVGCVPAQTFSGEIVQPKKTDVVTIIIPTAGDSFYLGYLTKYIDEEAGVVCYITASPSIAGISCLPIKDTLIKR
jgi:hypothetical protein